MRYQPSRRNFIVASGITALASTRILGANDTVRVGVIGAGGRSRWLLTCADQASPYQIAAVSDVYGPYCDFVKQRSNGVATIHGDYRELLQQPLDAVLPTVAQPSSQSPSLPPFRLTFRQLLTTMIF